MFTRTLFAVVMAASIVKAGTAFAQTAPAPAPAGAGAPAATSTHHHDRNRLFAGLGLSDDQKARIRAIRQKYREQNQNVTDKEQRRSNMLAMRKEIMSVLTPEQQQKVQARIDEMRARHQTQPQK